MATVLVTGVGGAGGIGAIRALQEQTTHEVVGVDMNADAAGLCLADHGQTIPPAKDDEWPSKVAAVVRRYDVDALVPLVDEELRRLPTLREYVPSDLAIVAPRQEVINTALDKWQTSVCLADAGHTVPETWIATAAGSIDPSRYPLLVKPRTGRGSRGVERLESPADLEDYIEDSDRPESDLVLQEYISGTEYTSSVVTTQDNRLLEVVPKEVIEKNGSTVKGVTRRNRSVEASCREVYNTLAPAGPLNVQQIVDESGTPYTIEINPRFSSTACLTVAAGVNELDILIRDAMGKTVSEPGGFDADLWFRRYPDHVFAPRVESMSQDRPKVAPEQT